jgi:hypothetical protein
MEEKTGDSKGLGFVAESERLSAPHELRLRGEMKVVYGETTGRVHMLFGRSPDAGNRTKHERGTEAGLKVILRSEKGDRIGAMPRRAVEARYSAGRWEFLNLRTGAEKVALDSDVGLGNVAVDLAPGYQLKVALVSGAGQSQRVESFRFERKK